VRRTRTVVLNEGQVLNQLDLWPGDQVIRDGTWELIGVVNADGQFIALGE
jgi:hypothetical protein